MSFVKVLVVSLVLGAVGCVLIWATPSWFPVQASVQAQRHDTLYFALMVMSAFILAIVTTFLVYSLVKFRRPEGDLADGPPIHGHTQLELIWTLIPTLLVIGFAIYGGVVLSKNESLSSKHLTVNVIGQQFFWTFNYPGEHVTSGILVLPVDREVDFRITSVDKDVIHEFYVPQFRVGEDAVPGLISHTYATPTRIGTYTVICFELCGLGHSQMRAIVKVVSQSEYQRWLEQQRSSSTQGGTA